MRATTWCCGTTAAAASARARGNADWSDWLTNALGPEGGGLSLLREPAAALELIDRYLLRTLNLQALANGGGKAPRRIAVVIEFAEFVVPRGDALQLGGPFAANVVKVLGWANDPAIAQANIVTVLVSEGLHDLNTLVVENPHAAALHVPLPDEAAMRAYVNALAKTEFPALAEQSEVPIDAVGTRLTGLSRVGARTAIALALRNDKKHHRRLACTHQEGHDRARMPGACSSSSSRRSRSTTSPGSTP